MLPFDNRTRRELREITKKGCITSSQENMTPEQIMAAGLQGSTEEH